MNMRVVWVSVLLSLVGLNPVWAQDQINVAVSILPLAYLVEEVGQDKVHVLVMIPPGGNPHTYEPTPGQLKALSDSLLYIKVGSGVEFEDQWLNKISSINPSMRMVNSSKGISRIAMTDYQHAHAQDGHAHGKTCDHGGMDPHVWLSPSNAIVMVVNVREALIDVDPSNQAFYQANAASLIVMLSELKQEIAGQLADLQNRKFFIVHPAWGYFANEFDLEQIAIEHLGKDPTPRKLVTLIQQAQKLGVRAIFTSPQFSEHSAQAIAKQINGRVEFIDPLAKEYVENLRRAARLISGNNQ